MKFITLLFSAQHQKSPSLKYVQFVNKSPDTLLEDMKQALKNVGLNTQALYNISSPVACQKD